MDLKKLKVVNKDQHQFESNQKNAALDLDSGIRSL
jgi:hypothetical protein